SGALQGPGQFGPVDAGIWLTWTPPPALTASFTGPAYVFVGSSGTYTATASNQQSPYTYQWQKNGVNIAGATSRTYTYSPIHPENVFQLAVRVGSANGKVATSPSQGVYGRYDVGTTGPEIVVSLDPPPTWQAIVNGGVGTIHYQWYFTEALTPVGTDSPSWTFDVTTNDGRYPVIVDATDAVGNYARAEVWVSFSSGCTDCGVPPPPPPPPPAPPPPPPPPPCCDQSAPVQQTGQPRVGTQSKTGAGTSSAAIKRKKS
ncbi:MAG TPA: hypothetical protein VK648_02000, partial [Gemmatimonadaceae bacterium]|nr:hypothetical protein [Gemmatimonadaceae bacterium]